MTSQPKSHLTPDEYLQLERGAERKSEYYRGEMYAMGGASREHNLIAANVLASLHGQLRHRPCEAYQADMRVKVSPAALYTYPDIVVVCGKPHFEDAELDTLLNPTVLIEVLSPSTEAYDRGAKFEQYRSLASLVDYLLIAQERCHVEHFSRQPDGRWLLAEVRRLEETVRIASIECELALTDVYEKVPLESVG